MEPIKKQEYDKIYEGMFGYLGKENEDRILFIETAIPFDELDDISLITEIPESNKWSVQELFQRDIDERRVEDDIIPFLTGDDKFLYFNPITLILLPAENYKKNITKVVKELNVERKKEDNIDKVFLTNEGNFQIELWPEQGQGSLKWKNKNCYLVAIDGQHRISALKRIKKKNEISHFSNWKIPTVILNIITNQEHDIISIIRKLFVYINTKGERINRTQEILLNDESVNAMCTQELINYCHQNDNKEEEEREECLPLYIFDWKGRTNLKTENNFYLLTVEEIHEWFENYILDVDASDKQKHLLIIESNFFEKTTVIDKGKQIIVRDNFVEYILEGMIHILYNFTPYKIFIELTNQFINDITESDIKYLLQEKLRFDTITTTNTEHFQNALTKYIEANKIAKCNKSNIDKLILEKIGMRAIISSYGRLKRTIYHDEYKCNKFTHDDVNWLGYSQYFVKAINNIYDEGWFKEFVNIDENKKEYMRYIVYKESGDITNYKLDAVNQAFGRLLTILVGKQFVKEGIFDIDQFDNLWSQNNSYLSSKYQIGFKKYWKIELSRQGVAANTLNKMAEEKANESSKKIMEELEKYCKE
jgi:hypothetical protein